MQQTLFLMMGYPGAGKTTVAKHIASLTGAVHVSSDELRTQMFPNSQFTQAEHGQLYKALNDKTNQLLSQGKSVVYDANLNRHIHRQEKYDICSANGVKSVLIWVQTDKSTAKARAAHDSRSHLWPPNETPQEMFDRIAGILEQPQPNEPHITINGETVTEQGVKQALVEAGIL